MNNPFAQKSQLYIFARFSSEVYPVQVLMHISASPSKRTSELPLYLQALGPQSRFDIKKEVFGRRNVRQAFTSRYLSFKVECGGEGGVVGCSQATPCHEEIQEAMNLLSIPSLCQSHLSTMVFTQAQRILQPQLVFEVEVFKHTI